MGKFDVAISPNSKNFICIWISTRGTKCIQNEGRRFDKHICSFINIKFDRNCMYFFKFNRVLYRIYKILGDYSRQYWTFSDYFLENQNRKYIFQIFMKYSNHNIPEIFTVEYIWNIHERKINICIWTTIQYFIVYIYRIFRIISGFTKAFIIFINFTKVFITLMIIVSTSSR